MKINDILNRNKGAIANEPKLARSMVICRDVDGSVIEVTELSITDPGPHGKAGVDDFAAYMKHRYEANGVVLPKGRTFGVQDILSNECGGRLPTPDMPVVVWHLTKPAKGNVIAFTSLGDPDVIVFELDSEGFDNVQRFLKDEQANLNGIGPCVHANGEPILSTHGRFDLALLEKRH